MINKIGKMLCTTTVIALLTYAMYLHAKAKTMKNKPKGC